MAEQWLKLDEHEITTDDVHHVLQQVDDDLWVTSACVDCVADSTSVQRALLDLGISRSDRVVERCTSVVALAGRTEALISHFENTPEDARMCCLRSFLLQRLDRLNTYVEMEKLFPSSEPDFDEVITEWEDDPWMGRDDNGSTTQTGFSDPPPILLSEFLRNDLLWSACEIASATAISALRVLLRRHSRTLWPSRFKILQCIPAFTEPSICRDLLPSLDHNTAVEVVLVQDSWRPELDFVELPETQEAFTKSCILPPQFSDSMKTVPDFPILDPLTPTELSAWYRSRVDVVLSTTGMVNIALALVQHGASQGVPCLDELGEDLSLLSRLVYDAPHGEELQEDWTLTRWYSMDPLAVVNAYLAYSTAAHLVRDVWRLVIPYLYAIEARAVRAEHPDPFLHTRLIYDYILTTSLDNVAAIFEESKPTLPTAQRLIKNDEDMSRLALACLYGNMSLDKWATMSAIFECLPVWEVSKDDDSYVNSAEATLASLAAFITPNTNNQSSASPRDLLKFFEPLSFTVLSQALDILDVHLESGEILSKWHVPAPLRWFLQSSADVNEQRACANRLARRGKAKGDRLNNEEDSERLLKDMLKLTGSGDTSARGAFYLLTSDDIMEIFLNALLSNGYFSIAKTMLYSSSSKLSLGSEAIERVSLGCSQDLYDNARSSNYKIGDMKLAYECLDIPRPSDTLTKAKEFIEATSRIASFNVLTSHGSPISPIEIRLTKDRLSLISRVLSSNTNAYRHAEVILELCNKLGYRDDPVAEVKVLAMLADTALHSEDFDYAYGNIERMIALVSSLRNTHMGLNEGARDAAEVCWVACFQLGRQPEFLDLEKKMVLLGNALEFCPPEKIYDVLTAWKKLEVGDVQRRVAPLRTRLPDFHVSAPPLLSSPDAAALASRTFKSVAANFSFSVGHPPQSDTSQSEGRKGDASSQASRVLSKGIGWLIGSDSDF